MPVKSPHRFQPSASQAQTPLSGPISHSAALHLHSVALPTVERRSILGGLFWMVLALMLALWGLAAGLIGCSGSHPDTSRGPSRQIWGLHVPKGPTCPTRHQPVDGTSLPFPPTSPDWVVLTTTGWEKVAEEWASYRRSLGHHPVVWTMSEILAGRPLTRREFLSELHGRLRPLRERLPSEIPLHLFLLGAPLVKEKPEEDSSPGDDKGVFGEDGIFGALGILEARSDPRSTAKSRDKKERRTKKKRKQRRKKAEEVKKASRHAGRKVKQESLVSHRSVPTFSWNDKFYTDAPYADLDEDGLPEISLGRVPAKTPSEALLVLEKTRRYESGTPPWPQDNLGQPGIHGTPGTPHSRILLFASEGYFGAVLDALLEKVGFEMVRTVPDRWHITFIHARKRSPYALPPSRYNQVLTQELNRGAFLSVYLGHGYPEALEKIRWSKEDQGPILDLSTLPRIRCGSRCPVMVLVACHTGRPLGGGGLAERIVLQPEAPPAVVASTEVSHPYPNALIVSGLNQQLLWLKTPTLGEAFRKSLHGLRRAHSPVEEKVEALAALIWKEDKRKEMREEHLRLYSLYGDPALRLHYSRGHLQLDVLGKSFKPGETLSVCAQIKGPVAGTVKVTLETPREKMAHRLSPWTDETPERDDLILENWRRANDKTIKTEYIQYTKGRLSFYFRLPPGLEPGSYVLRAQLYGGPGSAQGTRRLDVSLPPPIPRPQISIR